MQTIRSLVKPIRLPWLTALWGALLSSIPLAAQDSAPVVSGSLSPDLDGYFVGQEFGSIGALEGRNHFHVSQDGKWTLLWHQSLRRKEIKVQYVQVFRRFPDGQVKSWSFAPDGQFRFWSGRIYERDMVLRYLDEAGNLLGQQTFTWDLGGYEFSLLGRKSPQDDMMELLSGEYRKVREFPPSELSAAARKRSQDLAYGYFLGEFQAQEEGEHGKSQGRIRTSAILNGSWYKSEYETEMDGEVTYSGFGFTHCSDAGQTQLYWFDSNGGYDRFQGAVTATGANAERLNNKGEVVEKHRDTFLEGGHYRFELFVPDASPDSWKRNFLAEYRKQP